MLILLATLLVAAPAEAPVRFGMPAPLGAEQAQRDAAGLAALLSEALGRHVSVEVDAPAALAQRLARGSIDAAWLSSSEYVAARAADSGVAPAARLVRGGVPFYRSAIFVRRGGPRTLQALKGRRIAFVDEQSAAGYLVPRRLLLGAGFTPADLAHAMLLGDHAKVCKAVLDGAVDAGATFANDGRGGLLAGCVESVGAEKSRALKVLATSDPIPNDVIAVRPGAAALCETLRSALLRLRAPGSRARVVALFHADGFAAADDRDFASLRAIRQ